MSFIWLCMQAYKSHRSQLCGVKPIATHCKAVAVMVSTTQYYMYVSSVGMKSAESFSVNPIVVHMNWTGGEKSPVFAAVRKFLNEATIDSVLLPAIQQFEDQAINRLQIASLYGAVMEILVQWKFWSGGPKSPENLVRRTIIFRKYWSTRGIMVRAQTLQCTHFNDISLCRSIYIVSESLKK